MRDVITCPRYLLVVFMCLFPRDLQVDVEDLRDRGVHFVVAGPRDDNPAQWEVLVLGDYDYIVGTTSVSAMLNAPFRASLYDTLGYIPGWLTHSGLVKPYGDKFLGQHWLR